MAYKTNIPEKVGFEPTEPCGSTVFKTASFDHSDTSPQQVPQYIDYQALCQYTARFHRNSNFDEDIA